MPPRAEWRVRRPIEPSQLRELLHTFGRDDAGGGLDEREVGECLREVPQMPAGVDVELLGEEPERRSNSKQSFHQIPCPLFLADDGECGD